MDGGERWERIKELFVAALEHDSSERSAFLDEACGQDHELRREVGSLLSAHEKPNDLSEHPWRDQVLEVGTHWSSYLTINEEFLRRRAPHVTLDENAQRYVADSLMFPLCGLDLSKLRVDADA